MCIELNDKLRKRQTISKLFKNSLLRALNKEFAQVEFQQCGSVLHHARNRQHMVYHIPCCFDELTSHDKAFKVKFISQLNVIIHFNGLYLYHRRHQIRLVQ